MATATLTSKGQITIPVRVRSVRELDGMFKGRRKKPLSIKEMNAAIARRAADLFK